MDAILDAARRYDIAVIEEAAEAIGAEYKGRRAGNFGDTGVFSFHGSKTLTTGEGGMLVTDREDIRQRVLSLRDHGRQPGDRMFCNTEIGYKYKMSSMQTALGFAQLERIEDLISQKRQIVSWYRERLEGVAGVTLNAELTGTKNVFWMVTVFLDAGLGPTKTELMEKLGTRGIDSRPFFHSLSSLPAYAASAEAAKARGRNRISYQISPYGINLPFALSITEEQVDHVCQAFGAILADR